MKNVKYFGYGFLAVSLFTLAVNTAFATEPGNYPANPPDNQQQGQAQGQQQGQAAIGLGVGIGEGGNAVSGADAHATGIGIGGKGGNARSTAFGGNQHQTAVSDQTQTASADNAGNSLSTSYSSRDRAYALGLSTTATAAPFDPRVCIHKQTRGVDLRPLPVGFTGNNKYDAACIEEERDRAHCVALADRLAAWGQIEMAVRQLQDCDGVSGEAVIEPIGHVEPVDLSGYATKEELNRAFTESVSK